MAGPTRSRHFLRRYAVLKQRIAQGEVTMRHVPDEHMAADFLTKWAGGDKLRRSLRYVTNTWRSHEASVAEHSSVITASSLDEYIAALDAIPEGEGAHP